MATLQPLVRTNLSAPQLTPAVLANPNQQALTVQPMGNKTTTAAPPTAKSINTDAEVKRKALAGIPLINPTTDKLNAYNGYQQQATQSRTNQAFTPVDTGQYKTQSATINDIAAKYGFDFSREYANRQAEAEAQARRNANADAQRRNTSNRDVNLKSIDNNLMSQAEGLDRNYFQQYMAQQQGQVNGGMNGGIAADQDLRLAMSRQAAMGDSYRDANLGRMQENSRFTNDDIRLAEELGLINQQGLAREDSLYNDRLMQGAGLAQNQDQFNLAQNGMLLNADMQQRGQNIGIEQFLQEMARMKSNDQRSAFESDRGFNRGVLESDRNFDWTKTVDNRDYNRGVLESDRGFNRGVLESDRGYNRGVVESDRNFGLDSKKFDWSKYMDSQNLGLSKQRLAQDKTAQSNFMSQQSPQIQQQWTDVINEMINKTGQNSNTRPGALGNVDKYYQAIDQMTGGNSKMLYEKFGISPPPPALNKNLDPWALMKMIGG